MPRKSNKDGLKKPTKSELIREMAADNPGVGPTEIAKKLHSLYKIKVTPAMVSTVLSQDRKRGDKPVKRGRPVRQQKPTLAERAANNDALINLEAIDMLRTPQERMAKALMFGYAYGGKNGLPGLNRVCRHRRERAVLLIMDASKEVGGLEAVMEIIKGLQIIIQPTMPTEAMSKDETAAKSA